MRSWLVIGTRTALGVSLSVLLVWPAVFLLLDVIDTYLKHFETIRLLSITATVSLAALGASVILPRVREQLDKVLFRGSFDYHRHIRTLAIRIASGSEPHPLETTTSELAGLTGAYGVRIVDGSTSELRPSHLAVPLSTEPRIAATLVFGPKANGDPWVPSDRRLMSWFVETVSVVLNLARALQLEERRLQQIKKQVAGATLDLRELNQSLAQRDRNHATHLDQLAHDLKNPIINMCNALEEATWEPGAERLVANEHYRQVRAEAFWMAKFVDHMLDISRAEAGKTQLHLTTVNLFAMVQQVREDLSRFARTQRRTIEWDPLGQHDKEASVRADAAWLSKVITLMLMRAVRLARGAVHVAVVTHDRATHVDVILTPKTRLSASDLRSLLDRLSHKWTEHDDRQIGITGLELAITKTIAEAHGGSLSIPEADGARLVLRLSIPSTGADICPPQLLLQAT